MSSPEHCLALADEADRLAGIVSYEPDKHRLHTQAAAWRQMAAAIQAPGPTVVETAAPACREVRRSGVAGWFDRRRA